MALAFESERRGNLVLLMPLVSQYQRPECCSQPSTHWGQVYLRFVQANGLLHISAGQRPGIKGVKKHPKR
jgi:hypothetical protein